MNSKKLKSKYLKCSILIISLCIILGAISACLPFSISLPDMLDENGIDKSAMTITTNASDGLGEFNDGSSYVYTDKDLIDKYRAGDASTPYDMTIQKVAKTTSNRGTKENPYAISSTNDWKIFAKLMETDANRGSGKYFVLTQDIDFDGEDFYPIRFFKGTFYGQGYSLKNIKVSNWIYLTGTGENTANIASTTYGFGVFCQTNGAAITDLIVDNYNYIDMPATNAYQTRVISSTGGIIGLSLGSDYILNCHTYGRINSSITYGNYPAMGGIIGSRDYGVGTSLIYRCSAQVYMNIKAIKCAIVGGIIGEAINSNTIKIYDCIADFDFDTTGVYMHASGLAGLMHMSTWYVENTLSNININSDMPNAAGGMTGIWDGDNVNKTILNYSNCYSAGLIGSTETNKKPLYCATGSISIPSSYSQANINNVKVVKDPTKSYAVASAGTGGAFSDTFGPLGRIEIDNIGNLIGDAQAYATAKEMIDLREDQIERYVEYLKEQKAMR